METFNIAIYIYNDVEVLDFTGPYEVFNAANNVLKEKMFDMFLVAESTDVVFASSGLKIVPHSSINNSPQSDILIIPGGEGRRIQMNHPIVLDWVKSQFIDLKYLLSVCTGSFIIGKAGLLKGLKAATHHSRYDEFEKTFPDTELVKNVSYIDNGKIITSAGVSTGILASLHLLEKISGSELGKQVTEYMELNY